MSELRTASPSSTAITVGVDTHKFVHVAVAIDRDCDMDVLVGINADNDGHRR